MRKRISLLLVVLLSYLLFSYCFAVESGFFAVTSGISSSSESRTINLVSGDGTESEYSLSNECLIEDTNSRLSSDSSLFSDEEAVFVWARIDDQNQMDRIAVLHSGMEAYESGESIYRGKYDIVDGSGLVVDGTALIDGSQRISLHSKASFYEVTAIRNKNGNIIDFNVEIFTRYEYDGEELPEGSLLAVKNGTVRFVFISSLDTEPSSKENVFYVATSGIITNNDGRRTIEVIGSDGIEVELVLNKDCLIDDPDSRLEDTSTTFINDMVTFLWIKFDEQDRIERIVVLRSGMKAYESGDEIYRGKYDIVDGSGLRVEGTGLIGGEQVINLSSMAFFIEAKVLEGLTGVDVEVLDRYSYDGLKLPDGTLIAIRNPIGSRTVKYVFVSTEENQMLKWGRLGSINTSKKMVKIDTSSATKLGITDDSIEDDDNVVEGALVGYVESKDGKYAAIKWVYPISRINDKYTVYIVDGDADVDEDDDFIPLLGRDKFDTDASNHKDEEKVPVYKVTMSYKASEDTGKITSVQKVGEGRGTIKATAKAWDRITYQTSSDGNLIAYFVFTGMFDRNNSTDEINIIPDTDDMGTGPVMPSIIPESDSQDEPGEVTPSGDNESGEVTPSGDNESGEVTPSGDNGSGEAISSGDNESGEINPSGDGAGDSSSKEIVGILYSKPKTVTKYHSSKEQQVKLKNFSIEETVQTSKKSYIDIEKVEITGDKQSKVGTYKLTIKVKDLSNQVIIDADGNEVTELTLNWEIAKKETSGGGGGGGGGSSSSDNTKETEKEVIKETKPSGDKATEPKEENKNESKAKATEKFSDVTETDWFKDAVQFVIDNNYFNGTSDNIFSPNKNMSRGMIVTVLHRVAGTPASTSKNVFKDVDSNEYYYNALNWAVENGIINGISEDEFGTNKDVSRDQLVTVFYRFAKLLGKNVEVKDMDVLSSFDDKDSIEEYAKEAFAWAIENGIINGRSATELASKGTATRAEVATIVQRFVEFINK